MGEPAPVESLRLGVIRASGPDVDQFLRAQLSNDVLRLGPDRHFLAAWCDAKGRTQLVLRVAMSDDAYLLLLPRELLDAALQKLRMFVLRLKVELTDVSADYQIVGVHDDDRIPPVDRTEQRAGQIWLGLPGSQPHPARALVLTRGAAEPPAPSMPADSADWAMSEIDAGLAQVTAATQNEFVPQMLNLHWLMAVDFDKGCYPGQEVIARLQHRGRLTRRVFRLAWQGRRPTPGEPVHTADKTVGQVLLAAGENEGRLLAVVQVDAAAAEALHIDDGQTLELLELPYPTPA
ncbi:hypothetical protein V5738_11430 [Salinisphaera sp. SPP-AMP-43]|uniref:CAF17-like 4Fe-4S cluster assembly/insertion protein YgfZ n=1 Tax=Salinisphaera sp. SPP-AMP-43 TaxID=3121288 RepID=UPI003C6E57BA